MLKCQHPVEVPAYLDRMHCSAPTSMNDTTAGSISPANAASAPAKRACDACHRRKVKCIGDGTRTCKNCNSAGLTCTYNAIPQKKGPKGSRAKVISELRETQRQTQLATTRYVRDLDSPPHSPSAIRRHGLLSMDMITSCVEYYFAHLYPTQPVLHRINVRDAITTMETSVESYCMIVALCAYMMIQPNMNMPTSAFDGLRMPPQSSLQAGKVLLEEAIRVRKEYDFIESPTIMSIITSFFFFGSHFCLDRHNTAWFHLREATTLAQIVGLHEESSYGAGDMVENARKRRLYWLLFVTERAYALQKHRPLTLHATINTPTVEETATEGMPLNGFVNLVNLFRPFDDTFVGLWNKARVGATSEWMAALQQQLSDALPDYLHCTESQAVDLRCSQQWLRTMVWQLAMHNRFLSIAAADASLRINFPLEISRDLVSSAATFSRQAMEVHGIGLIEKLFDVACTLTDVMSVLPAEQYAYVDYGPREYLHQLMTLIGTLRGGRQRYMPILLEKVRESVPAALAPGYGFPNAMPSAAAVTAVDSRLQSREDGFEEEPLSHPSSASGSALHSSAGSTPFGSPPSNEATAFVFADMAASTSNMALGGPTSAPVPPQSQTPLYVPTTMHGVPSVLASYDRV